LRCVRGALVALFLTMLSGCDRDEIEVYRVAKEQTIPPPTQAQANKAAGHPGVGTPAAQRPTWKTPAGWNETPPGEMRVASFRIQGKDGKQADVSVVPLPGGAGGDLANVNRWRKQLGLSELSSDEISQSVKSLETAGGKATLVEMSGTDARSGQPAQLVAVIVRRSGQTWFYKLMGDSKVVEAQKEAFMAFVQSVKY
jgi:hypothetical protein